VVVWVVVVVASLKRLSWESFAMKLVKLIHAVVVSAVLAVPSLAHAGNILVDPGFEQRTPPAQGGWTLFGAAFSSGQARSGRWAMLDQAWFGVVGAFQQYPAAPGSRWQLTGSGLAPVQLEGAVAFGVLQVSFFDAQGRDLGTVETAGGPVPAKVSASIDASTPPGSWTRLDTGVATAPAGAAYVQAFTLYVDFSGFAQAVLFDDLRMDVLGVSHRQYVADVARNAAALRDSGQLTPEQAAGMVKAAAQSAGGQGGEVEDAPGVARCVQEPRRAFTPAPGTVAVNFSVDDRANQAYGPCDLRWKGSFLLDAVTRQLRFDPAWSGAAQGEAPRTGWPMLYDDGPWTQGGHEPEGERAGDHVWGVAVFVAPPWWGVDAYQYGLVDDTYEASLGNGWVWKGSNGTFEVPAGASAAIDAPGQTFPAFGGSDLLLTLDTRALSPMGWWNLSGLRVKSSAWSWGELPLLPLGAGRFGLQLSSQLGQRGAFPHSGLLSPGDVPEFVFTLGGVEYKGFDWSTWSAAAFTEGVTAAILTRCSPVPTPVAISVLANGNTAITVPASSCGDRER
jgi:hypothetical protein